MDTEPVRARHLILTDPHQKLAALSYLAQKSCRGRAWQSDLGEFIALDDGHTERESPETHISAVGAVRPLKRRLCEGANQADDTRFVAIRRFNWLHTGEAIASHLCLNPKLTGTRQGKRKRVRCSV